VSHVISGKLNSNQDGSSDIIIARDDGSVEIYNFTEDSKPNLRYQINFQESITGLGIGNVTNATYAEAVISTSFSGKIQSLID
jgi:hypothetical protein